MWYGQMVLSQWKDLDFNLFGASNGIDKIIDILYESLVWNSQKIDPIRSLFDLFSFLAKKGSACFMFKRK